MSSASLDQFGRRIEYLRISVTDRCNFRCAYCMPLEGLPWLPRESILTYEEITEVVRQLAPLGVSRLRITGGEPTIRPQLSTLISMLRRISGIQDIALSTNGVKLPEMAAELAAAGLDRVNMSADSLRADRIKEIARRSLAFSPIDAAMAAERAGLGPVKINTVVMRGINDDELEEFARLTLEHPWHVRFIELMPVGEMASLTMEHVVPSDEILARLSRIAPLLARCGSGARQWSRGVLSIRGRAGERGRDHADESHVLRRLQPRASHCRWATAHVLVRRRRSELSRCAASGRGACAVVRERACGEAEGARAVANARWGIARTVGGWGLITAR